MESQRTPTWLMAIPTSVFCFLILPHMYGGLAFGPRYMEAYPGPYLDHVLSVCAANFAVMLSSGNLKGRLDRKLAAVLTRVLIIHGAIAFGTLMLHLVHSNEVMLIGVLVSLALGLSYMLLEHLTVQPRIGVIGGTGPALAWLENAYRGTVQRINDPESDVRGCDLVLVPSMSELSAPWALLASRAMLSGIPVRHIAEYLEEAQGFVSVEHFDLDHLPLGGLTSYRLRKRVLDVALIIATAPITLPLAAIGALVVFVSMGGPVFFVQDRTGVSGQTFRMYKLRTMRPITPGEARQATAKADVRVTAAGIWLRRFRIDELPQLWNVLKGDMSIIGPRPEWTVLAENYQQHFPAYAYRHLVRPGITGWAQVRSGYAADLEETKVKVGYDLFYIKNLSFALDMQILARTIWTLASGSGAR